MSIIAWVHEESMKTKLKATDETGKQRSIAIDMLITVDLQSAALIARHF